MIRYGNIVIDRDKRSIAIGEKHMHFSGRCKVAFKAFEALLLSGPYGMNREQIYEVTHGDCPEGGTIGGPKDVHVWVTQTWKPILETLGLEIRRRRNTTINRNVYYFHVV